MTSLLCKILWLMDTSLVRILYFFTSTRGAHIYVKDQILFCGKMCQYISFTRLDDLKFNCQHVPLCTIGSRYNAVQFITILHTALRWQQQNVNQTSKSQETPHTSPWRASYEVSIMRIVKKTNRVITAPRCIWPYYSMGWPLIRKSIYTMVLLFPWHWEGTSSIPRALVPDNVIGLSSTCNACLK